MNIFWLLLGAMITTVAGFYGACCIPNTPTMLCLLLGLVSFSLGVNKIKSPKEWVIIPIIAIYGLITLTRSPGIYLTKHCDAIWWCLSSSTILLSLASVLTKKRFLFLLGCCTFFLGCLWTIKYSPSPLIDVVEFFREGTDNILHGINPYTPGIENIYGKGAYNLYPKEIINGDKIMVGFCYPITNLGVGLLGEVLLRDYRIIFSLILTIGIFLIGYKEKCRLIGVILLLNPSNYFIIEQGWVDSLSCGLLLACIAIETKSAFGSALLQSLWIGTKAYYLPFLAWKFPSYGNKKQTIIGLTIAIMVSFLYLCPLLFSSWGDYYKSTIWMISHQAPRLDSLSYTIHGGWILLAATSVFLIGLIKMLIEKQWIKNNNDRFALLVYLFLGFLTFNKVCFINYLLAASTLITCLAYMEQTKTEND